MVEEDGGFKSWDGMTTDEIANIGEANSVITSWINEIVRDDRVKYERREQRSIHP